MGRKKFLLAILFAVLVIFEPLSASAENFKDFNAKEFYRSLSKRLGKKRADYPALSDSEFANFRMVRTSGIAEGRLYRSSSPVSDWSERYEFAAMAAASAGVKTIINLADSDESLKSQKGYPGSYYSQQNVIALNVNTKYKSKRFKTGLARGIHFMAVNDPPYLVHCSLGKDRAGFVIALIECFAGASLQEVERDNMLSFYNYFGILPGSREYDFVLNCEIYRFLCEAFGVQKLEGINLSDAAERFFLKIGVSVKDIETLRKKLSS